MKRATSNRSLLTIPFTIPAYCSPYQALAMAKLLEGLRELILADYPLPLFDAAAQPHKPAVSNESDSSPNNGRNDEEGDELPF